MTKRSIACHMHYHGKQIFHYRGDEDTPTCRRPESGIEATHHDREWPFPMKPTQDHHCPLANTYAEVWRHQRNRYLLCTTYPETRQAILHTRQRNRICKIITFFENTPLRLGLAHCAANRPLACEAVHLNFREIA
jgi:hypothetical protein